MTGLVWPEASSECLQYQRQGALGKGCMVYLWDLCIHQKAPIAEEVLNQVGSMPLLVNTSQVCSQTLRCQGVGFQGPRNYDCHWVTLGSSGQKAVGKERSYCFERDIQPWPTHSPHLRPCLPLSCGPGLNWEKGEGSNQIWLKYTSRSRQTYPWKLCLNSN